MSIIRTENLTKFYGKARGIVDVSLSVEEGEFFGFIGPNGAGKSTTIRTLLGLLQKTSGGAWVLEREVGRENTAILADVGYLPGNARRGGDPLFRAAARKGLRGGGKATLRAVGA